MNAGLPASKPLPTRQRGRRIAIGGSAVAALIVAGWFCFAPPGPISVPGTVRVIDAGTGNRVLYANSHAAAGTIAIVAESNRPGLKLLSDHWETVDLSSSVLQCPSGFETLPARPWFESDADRRTLIQNQIGLGLREPGGHIDLIRLLVKRSSDNSSYRFLKCLDHRWQNGTLEILTESHATSGLNRLRSGPSQLRLIRYVIPPDEGRERNVRPLTDEVLRPGDVFWAAFLDDGWVTLMRIDRNRPALGQKVVTSFGYEAALAGTQNPVGATPLVSYRTAIVGSDNRGLYAVRCARNRDVAELVDIPFLEAPTRTPLTLDVPTANVWIDGITSDGRYALVRGADGTTTYAWLERMIPALHPHVVNQGLALVDLKRWHVVASWKRRRTSLFGWGPHLSKCSFSHDDTRVLIPNGQYTIEVDIEKWIAATRP